jgi:phage tail-like protein
MAKVTDPFASHSYVVSLRGPRNPEKVLGGFSAVSGLSHIQKITGMNKSTDVTLKRGVVDSSGINDWLSQVRAARALAARDVIITLRDKTGNPVQSWKLHNPIPAKYTGPTLSGKGNDLAIEELVLSAEGVEIVPHHHK